MPCGIQACKNRCSATAGKFLIEERVEIIRCRDAEQKYLAFRRARLDVNVKRSKPDQTSCLTKHQGPQLSLADMSPPRDQPLGRLKEGRCRAARPQRGP